MSDSINIPLEDTEEFDQEFYLNNQGVIKSQKFLKENISLVINRNNQIEKNYFYKVNMTNNNDCRIWGQGLNEIKRGRPTKSIPFENS